MKQRAQHRDPRQDLEREHHAFHEAGVLKNQAGRAIHTLGKQSVNDQADEQNQREVEPALHDAAAPPRLEDDAEEKGVHEEHEERRQERPGHAEDRAAIAAYDIPSGHLEDQLPMVPVAGEDSSDAVSGRRPEASWRLRQRVHWQSR